MHGAAFQIRDVLSQDELAVLGVSTPSVQICFAQVLRAVRHAFDIPIAFVHINHQRIDVVPPSVSLCGQAMQAESILLIESLPTEQHFKANHYFSIAPELQFFCGMPLRDIGGTCIGVLCLVDRRPRRMNADNITSLHDYAAWALAEWRAYQANQSMQAAREADRRLTNVLENVQDAVFTVDALANIMTVNPAAIKMFAFAENTLQSMNLAALITVTDVNWRNNIAALAQSLSEWSNRAGVVEMLGMRSDKNEFFLELTVSVLQRAPAPSYTVIAREISERKRAEQKIREGERLFKTVMDSTAFCVYVRDLEGRFLYVNREYEHVFHRDNRVDKGTLFTDVLNPELANTVYHIEQSVVANRESIWAENLVQREDGEYIYLVIRSPLLDETGAVIGTCGVATDMTPIKKLEKNMAEAMEALRVSEERWSFALEASGDGVWDWDITNNIV
jgi:PAS domain S-box-containing protein